MHPWIYKYYVEPIIYDTGYNPVNTLTWALIFGAMIFVLIKFFRYLDLKVDQQLTIYTIPYILAGASLRVIEDAEVVAPPFKYLLITPFIYFLTALVTVFLLVLCKKFLDENFLKGYALLGLLWTSINLIVLSQAGVERIWVLVVVVFLGTALTGCIWFLRVPLRIHFLNDGYYLLILYAHMLDASSTYIGVDWLGYYEKHVVPTMLINLTGTALVMYPLKLAILIPALSLIDSSFEGESPLKNLTKLALLVLGLAPAVRNTLRLVLGI